MRTVFMVGLIARLSQGVFRVPVLGLVCTYIVVMTRLGVDGEGSAKEIKLILGGGEK